VLYLGRVRPRIGAGAEVKLGRLPSRNEHEDNVRQGGEEDHIDVEEKRPANSLTILEIDLKIIGSIFCRTIS